MAIPSTSDRWRCDYEKGGKFIAGGNVGALFAGRLLSYYSSACVRRILLRNWGVEPYIDWDKPAFKLGAAWENHLESVFREAGYKYTREERIKKDLGDGVVLSGSSDFILYDMQGEKAIIVEAKACTSPKRIKSTFIHGEYLPGHFLQLLTYMMAHEIKTGYLIYGAMEDYAYRYKGKARDVKKFDSKQFLIEVDSKDMVTVSDTDTDKVEHSALHPHHINQFLGYASWALTTDAFDCQRPAGFSERSDPCKYCELVNVCNNLPSTKEEFIEDAIAAYKAAAPNEIVPQTPRMPDTNEDVPF